MSEGSITTPEAAWQQEVQEVVLASGTFVAPDLRATWARWLTAYTECYSRVAACRAVGVTLTVFESWREDYPDIWPLLLASADSVVAEHVAGEVWRRGVNGVERGVWYQGERVGSEMHYSDRALEMLAKRTDPVGWGVKDADRATTVNKGLAMARAVLASPEALAAWKDLVDALEASGIDLAEPLRSAPSQEVALPSAIIDVQPSNESS